MKDQVSTEILFLSICLKHKQAKNPKQTKNSQPNKKTLNFEHSGKYLIVGKAEAISSCY